MGVDAYAHQFVSNTTPTSMSRMPIDVRLICREENCPDVFDENGDDPPSFLRHITILQAMLTIARKLAEEVPIDDTVETRNMIQQMQSIARMKKPPYYYSLQEMELYTQVKAESRKLFCSRKKKKITK